MCEFEAPNVADDLVVVDRVAFATLHFDWKKVVAFSLCGDMRESRCQ